MALLNVSSSSLLSSKLPTKLLLSPPLSSPPHFSLPCYPAPQVGTLLTTPSPFLVKVFISISVFLLQATRNRLGASQALVSSLCESVSKASLLALLSASLLVADPALAFKVKFYSFTSCLVAEKPKEKKKQDFVYWFWQCGIGCFERVEVRTAKRWLGDRISPGRTSVERVWSNKTSKRCECVRIFPFLDIMCFVVKNWSCVASFVQSILRQANFKGAKLLGASFFDADLTGNLSSWLLFACEFVLIRVSDSECLMFLHQIPKLTSQI